LKANQLYYVTEGKGIARTETFPLKGRS